ncbi:uncharacterized protein MYCFIDRAFT_180255 [Pseudocercospora fijiensis CIRAD86]|uniref:Uncharacterized protein n=1 Tax=Pseudocercospora fijiensis (strain CIRAD86) TaxID=383855 RepID=M2YH11_PSEFD|nr:uncharacterized protein MYCFIDRAFT_180255 [Pseudocercospora fijiensis CIRAD86]EME77110.1 hypothetical protein MYCFIDRAFT_180255 [Pseudocercospora fijiensis CIRAD86]
MARKHTKHKSITYKETDNDSDYAHGSNQDDDTDYLAIFCGRIKQEILSKGTKLDWSELKVVVIKDAIIKYVTRPTFSMCASQPSFLWVTRNLIKLIDIIHYPPFAGKPSSLPSHLQRNF